MDDAFGVKELSRLNNLLEVALNLDLCQLLPPLQQIIERLVGAQLHNYVDIVFVLERALELHDIFTAVPCYAPKGFMYRNLSLELFKTNEMMNKMLYLLFGFGLFEACMWNDFHGDSSPLSGLVLPAENLLHLVALGETSLCLKLLL
jgi:hypothetical protein